MNLYLLKKQKQKKIKEDQESRMLGGGSGDEQNKPKNSENKAGCVRVWFEWGTYWENWGGGGGEQKSSSQKTHKKSGFASIAATNA